MFSKACEYGLKAMIYLAANSDEDRLLNLEEISTNIGSPVSFTSKVLQQLGRAKLISSTKGPAGGFKIEKSNLSKTNLYQIVVAIDGDSVFHGCGLGLHSCNENEPCPIHNRYAGIRNELKEMLESSVLSEYSGKLKSKEFVLTRLSK